MTVATNDRALASALARRPPLLRKLLLLFNVARPGWASPGLGNEVVPPLGGGAGPKRWLVVWLQIKLRMRHFSHECLNSLAHSSAQNTRNRPDPFLDTKVRLFTTALFRQTFGGKPYNNIYLVPGIPIKYVYITSKDAHTLVSSAAAAAVLVCTVYCSVGGKVHSSSAQGALALRVRRTNVPGYYSFFLSK